MKRSIAICLLLCLLLNLCACGTDNQPGGLKDKLNQAGEDPATTGAAATEPAETTLPTPETEPEKTNPTEPAVDSVFAGVYTAEHGAPEEECVLEIIPVGECFLLEFSMRMYGSVYSYWVEEFWPEQDDVADGQNETVYGQCQEFSGMGRGDEYGENRRELCISLTGDGLVLQYSDSGEETYTRVAEPSGLHSSREELLSRIPDISDGQKEETLMGVWKYDGGHTTAYLVFGTDQSFRYLCKQRGTPMKMLVGVWAVDDEHGDIMFMAERIGWGNMPYVASLEWSIDAEGYLQIRGTGDDTLAPLMGDPVFVPADEPEFDISGDQALGLFTDGYILDDSFENDYGDTCNYSYHVPIAYPFTSVLEQMNREITGTFMEIVREEQNGIEAGQELNVHTISWRGYVYDGVASLVICSDSFYTDKSYVVYHYDTVSDVRLDTRQMLERLHMDEEYFLDAIRSAAEEYYISQYSGLPEENREAYGYYRMLEWTVSDAAINLDVPVYVDEAGNIAAIVQIGSLAGADSYSAVLYPFSGAVG